MTRTTAWALVLTFPLLLASACDEPAPSVGPAGHPAHSGQATLEDWVPQGAAPSARAGAAHAIPGHAMPGHSMPGHGIPGHATPPAAGEGDEHAGHDHAPGAHPAEAPGEGPAVAAHGAPPGGIRGTVRETMNSGGYTYVRVETPSGMVWVASMQMEVSVGDQVEAAGMPMEGFRSNTLNRTFDMLVLASRMVVLDPDGDGAH